MLDSKVLNTDYDLAEMSDLQRPNLLDNADFKSGIINQRGQEEYNYGVTASATGNRGTIDRWISNCTKVSVEDGKIHIEYDNSTAYSYLQQKLSYVCNGDYTLYIKVSNVTDGSMFIAFNGNQSDKLDISDDGEYVHTFKDVNNQDLLVMFVGTGFKGDIEYIKLEKGSVYTGMPVWNETLELLKCLRRFVKISNYRIRQYSTQNTVLIHPLQFPIEMAQNPSITCTASVTTNASNYGALSSNKNCVNLQWNVPNTGVSDLTLDIEADAEIY